MPDGGENASDRSYHLSSSSSSFFVVGCFPGGIGKISL
jgi:hypothetical protein